SLKGIDDIVKLSLKSFSTFFSFQINVEVISRWFRGSNRFQKPFFCTGRSPICRLVKFSSSNRGKFSIHHQQIGGGEKRDRSGGKQKKCIKAMEPPPNNNKKIPPDRAHRRGNSLATEPQPSTSAMATAAVSLPSTSNQLVLYSDRPSASFSSRSISSGASTSSSMSSQPTPSSSSASVSAPIERLSRPMAFDKMEAMVREAQEANGGVPVRSQKIFLTSIPSAFMGYDLIEWMMERLNIEESEALSVANQLCQHGYFFPVSDSKTLIVKDDSSLYRFQSPYYWPWRQQKAPDQIEYAIYLAKRSLRNRQRHGLEDYEVEALTSLKQNLKAKWDVITMQAEEQIKLSKDRKKGDKIVSDSQERAFWRVHRPPPGQFTPLEPCPVPSRDRQGRPRRRTEEDWKREIEITKASIGRNRMKMSTACESLVNYYETFLEYDPLMMSAQPSNPWVTEDITFWQLNQPVVENPTEKRVRRWAFSIEELVRDPTGLQEFTSYLRKEYSHENIRFWMAVNDLRRSAQSQIPRKAKEIYEEFLEPGAPCEINIDGKTMEKVQQGLKSPTRFTFDVAAEHVYTLLLKKDCYPRFIRSEHYKALIAHAVQPSHKKRFFGFGGPAKKKPSTTVAANPVLLTQMPGTSAGGSSLTGLPRRRGSDRSLTGSAHELAVCGVNKDPTKVVHSHSQSNLSELPYREPSRQLETTQESSGTACSVCPWDTIENDPPTPQPPPSPSASTSKPKLTIDLPTIPFTPPSDIVNTDVSERMKRSCGLRQNTLDCDFHSTKRLVPAINEQRRASMTITPRVSDLQFNVNPPTVTTSGPEDDDTSELSLVIDKADSIEEKEDESEKDLKEKGLENLRRKKTFSCDDIVIEEECQRSDEASSERKLSVVAMGSKKSLEIEELPSRPIEASLALPTSISTQTVPTEEFPENLVVTNANIKGEDAREGTQLNVVETQQEIDIKRNETRKFCSRSSHENDDGSSTGDKLAEISKRSSMSKTCDDQQQKQMLLAHQHSISQEEDYEVAMVSELLPGCVAPAPTPAPSIAPLAEIEVDPTEDDVENAAIDQVADPKPDIERKKKRKERRDKDGSDGQSQNQTTVSEGTSSNDPEKSKHNAVCPWEDEDVTTAVEAPFVKTYATLGYL
ncbi:CLUMA_CG017365, isoform B, partial [Clunio marinus]